MVCDAMYCVCSSLATHHVLCAYSRLSSSSKERTNHVANLPAYRRMENRWVQHIGNWDNVKREQVRQRDPSKYLEVSALKRRS